MVSAGCIVFLRSRCSRSGSCGHCCCGCVWTTRAHRCTPRPLISLPVPLTSHTILKCILLVGKGQKAVAAACRGSVCELTADLQAAKAAAATIRSFQPAIQEINQASSEIRTSITNEMGIDKLQQEFRDISQTTRDSLTFNPTLSATAAANKTPSQSESASSTASTEQPAAKTEVMETIPQELESFESQVAKAQKTAVEDDPDIERKRAESAALAWGGADAVPSPPESTPADTGGPRKLEDMSMAELERELERRKRLIKAIEDLNA